MGVGGLLLEGGVPFEGVKALIAAAESAAGEWRAREVKLRAAEASVDTTEAGIQQYKAHYLARMEDFTLHDVRLKQCGEKLAVMQGREGEVKQALTLGP